MQKTETENLRFCLLSLILSLKMMVETGRLLILLKMQSSTVSSILEIDQTVDSSSLDAATTGRFRNVCKIATAMLVVPASELVERPPV